MAVSIPGGVGPRPLLALLALLADGAWHSGADLARALDAGGVDLQGSIGELRAAGVDVDERPADGYRLPQALELLDAGRIRAALGETAEISVRRLEVLFDVDSTNSRLLAQPAPPPNCVDVCTSELQHAGRGRRGRAWVAALGDSLALSIAWTSPNAALVTPAMSLAVGVAVARGLTRCGAQGLRLKWPNDVWFEERKLGGILVELKTEPSGPAHVVIGVGLNVALSPKTRRTIEDTGVQVAAAADACAEPPSRNRLAGLLLRELLSMLAQFEREGFGPFRASWVELDGLYGRAVRVSTAGGEVVGVARGVDADGALLLETREGVLRFMSGEVSVRLTEGDA
jgi:BirA family transcriptional regulator, biotin operon repressor / biotin---[acetyl-CoA-carboxylase] ligase